MSAFKGIEQDCNEIMGKVKAEIWKNARSATSVSAIAEEMKLLVLLKEDRCMLSTEYLDLQLSILNNEKHIPTTIPELITTYLMPLEEVTNHFQHFFFTSIKEEDPDSLPIAITNIPDNEKLKRELLQRIEPRIDQFFEFGSALLKLPNNILDPDSLEQMRHLNEFHAAVLEHGTVLLSVTEIGERMDQWTKAWETECIDRIFETVIVGVKKRVAELPTSFSSTEQNFTSLTIFITDTETWLIQHIHDQCLATLQRGIRRDLPQFHKCVQTGLKNMWRDLVDMLVAFPDEFHLERLPAQIVMLVNSRLCHDFAETMILQIYNQFSVLFPRSKTESRQHIEEALNTPLLTDANEMIELCLTKGQRLLNEQMMQDGYRLSARIQEFYLNYTEDKQQSEPSCVSEIWRTILLQLQSMEQLMQLIYPQEIVSVPGDDGNSDTEHDYRFSSANEGMYSCQTQSTQSLTRISSSADAGLGIFRSNNDLMNNIDKLFADRVDIYGHTDPTPIGVCSGLVRVTLKAFHETVREMRLSSGTYQQLQFDVEYLRIYLWSYAGENNK
ncbi:Vacuolar protein sorting-associated protein 51 [Apophysomyces sp. BC1034]|nr:Vacuolar protein sorting-associated protein 51 [Apophysomyces sp. BC1021]KAG0191714.1 Vacuolar protein sorting-associated protein 51 [Apophysomyces sp. BC1034]